MRGASRPDSRAESGRRRIRLCADDYGISPAVSRAIRNLVSSGRLNATSVMVVAPTFGESEAQSLLDAAERFRNTGELARDSSPCKGEAFSPAGPEGRPARIKSGPSSAVGRGSSDDSLPIPPLFKGREQAAARPQTTAAPEGASRCAIGLHFTLTAPFRPLSAFRPTREGAFLPLGSMISRALLRQLDRVAVAAEIEAQIRAFVRAFAKSPDFIDGHHHVHLLPQIRDEVLDLARRMTPGAWVRQCGSAWPLMRLLRDPKTLGLSLLSRGLRRKAAGLGVPTNPAFAGAYDFEGDVDFPALFPRFLDGLPDLGVVMCHPGFADAELQRLDPLTTVREKEYSYLASEAFVGALQAAGAALA